MANVGDAVIGFRGDFSQVKRDATTQAKGLEQSFGGTFKNIAKAAAVSFAAVGVSKFLKSAFTQAEQSVKVGKQTDAVIKSTGSSANVTAKQVQTLATSLQNKAAIDDEVIKSGENVLLTFTNIRNEVGKGNDIFNQATEAVTNLSAFLGQDLQSSAIQVGKALNDPIKGITALRRVGVSFTKQQIAQVKALVDTGQTLTAQKVILKELTTEFGGAAAAAATPSERLKVAVGNLQESFGKLLIPVVAKASIILAGLATWVENNQGLALALAVAVGVLGTAFIGILIVNKIVGAVRAFQAAMVALNSTFLANPVVLVVAAIVALGVAVFIAYKKFGPFHDAVDRAWQILQNLFHWVQHNWPLLLAILTGPFGLATRFIIQHWTGIVSFFKAVVFGIGGAFKNVATVISAPFRSAFNAIARLWNSTIGKLSFHIPSWVPKIGGKGFDVPNIPTFDTGGIFNTTGGHGLAVLKSGEGVFTPSQMAALGTSHGIDARTIVMGNIIGDSHLQRVLADHDQKLVSQLAVGHR